MRIDVITLFPEFFRDLQKLGVTGSAIRDDRVSLVLWNPRDFTDNESRRVDDRPYGGGPGMVMQVGPLSAAVDAAQADASENAAVSLMSPEGRVFDQDAAAELADRNRLLLICGRYEGIDQRFVDSRVDEEWSLGDYVLSGGELAAAVIMDSVIRLLPEVLGDEQSAQQDSFSDGLLDCPHYTRPERLGADGGAVPEVLLSGDHDRIRRWRRMQALGRTWLKRPELLDRIEMNKEDRALLARFRQELESNKGHS